MMANNFFLVIQFMVFMSAVVYWSGVWIFASNVKKRIGRSPNLRPRTTKEWCLWGAWAFIILSWFASPFLVGLFPDTVLFRLMPAWQQLWLVLLGLWLAIAGYIATLWCYGVMREAWRIGIDPKEKTRLVQDGPYRVIRHPIYTFQALILLGIFFMLPCWFLLMLIVLHWVVVFIKARDEEKHMLHLHGDDYKNYCMHTGRFFPTMFSS